MQSFSFGDNEHGCSFVVKKENFPYIELEEVEFRREGLEWANMVMEVVRQRVDEEDVVALFVRLLCEI